MKGRPGDLIRILHMLKAVDDIDSYIDQMTYNAFEDSSITHNAVIRQLEIIGEAANHISSETKTLYPEVAWVQITALRNLLIHQYFGVDIPIVWQIIKTDLPILKEQLLKIKTEYQ